MSDVQTRRARERRLHLTLTGVWLLLAIPGVVWWEHSIPFLVFVSIYANVASHWAAFQASRAEEAAAQ